MDINSLQSSNAGMQKVQSNNQTVAPSQANQLEAAMSVAPSEQQKQKTSIEDLKQQISQLNEQLTQMEQSLSFTVDESTQSSVIKVVDKSTDEVIKQFPTEGSLKIMKNIQDYLSGVQQKSQTKEGLTGSLINEII